MFKKFTALICLALMAACSGPSTFVDLEPRTSDLRLRSLVGSAMVREVSLPTYAAAEEVAQEIAPGIISTNENFLWADEPQRAMTLALTSHLDQILTATVGPDPWPFAGLPDVSIEVRVSHMLAGVDQVYRLRGQYYVGGDGIDFRNSSHTFDIEVPLIDQSAGGVSAAHAEAVERLSEEIARRLAR